MTTAVADQIWLVIGGAFLGGALLNLMPCVFPVLSIKILGFLHMHGASSLPASKGRRDIRLHGWFYAFGVLVSFWILAILLLVLRAGGKELGWGFQLQSPGFIAVLTLLMFAIALNLAGVFEIGSRFIGIASGFDAQQGWLGSFNSGILTTVLATPCTAPFMGTALGVAVTLPPALSMIVFTALGAGMATPYILLCYAPGLVRRLPKPGPWMETLKQVMAFPLFATAIWLMWVFAQQVGVDGLLRLMFGMLLLSVALWILGRWNPMVISTRLRLITRALSLVFFVAALSVSLTSAKGTAVVESTAEESDIQSDLFGIRWEKYTEARLQRHLSNGRKVFIDFTAAWCITCKVNERTVFSSDAVRDRLNELNIAMIKADWTSQNPEITRKLAEFSRNSVPLYLLFDGKDGSSPEILPQILTTGIFLDALEKIR